MDAYHEVLNDIRDELPDLDIDEDSLVNAPSFATVEAARHEALDEAAEALNRRYLDGLDACEAEADATCFDDVLAVYDEHMDWLVQYAGGDWQPSTRY